MTATSRLALTRKNRRGKMVPAFPTPHSRVCPTLNRPFSTPSTQLPPPTSVRLDSKSRLPHPAVQQAGSQRLRNTARCHRIVQYSTRYSLVSHSALRTEFTRRGGHSRILSRAFRQDSAAITPSSAVTTAPAPTRVHTPSRAKTRPKPCLNPPSINQIFASFCLLRSS